MGKDTVRTALLASSAALSAGPTWQRVTSIWPSSIRRGLARKL